MKICVLIVEDDLFICDVLVGIIVSVFELELVS